MPLLAQISGVPVVSAAHLVEAMKSGLAKELPTQAAAMATAAKDPQPGLTLTFVFTFADQQSLAAIGQEMATVDARLADPDERWLALGEELEG